MKIIYLLSLAIVPTFIIAETFIVPKRVAYGPLDPSQRPGSWPYLSGDTFRSIADFVIDETKIPFNPAHIKHGDIIFLNADYLDFFFAQIHPCIKKGYILITHNCIVTVPGKYASYLNDKTLLAWFGKNADPAYPKMHTIPLGFANPHWKHGNPHNFEEIKKLLPLKKNKLLYINFTVSTNKNQRGSAMEYFTNKSFCYKAHNRPHKEYLKELAQSKFVLSPEGTSIDCHRTWEALIMGSIPIVKHSILDPMFDDLPVLLINDWSEITEDFLNEQYEIMKHKKYNLEKIYAPYWIQKIKNCQQQFRNS